MMKVFRNVAVTLTVAVGLSIPGTSQAEDVEEIMNKFDKVIRDSFRSSISRLKLSTCTYATDDGNMRCTEKPRVVMVEMVEKDYGPNLRDTKVLAVLIKPISEKGIGTLTYEYDEYGKDKDMWLYLPEIGRVKRLISNDDDGENFFGTEFLTENMENRKLQDYTYEIVDETTVMNRPVWVIELLPTDEKLKKSPFSKIVSYMDKNIYLPVKENFYNHNGKLYLQQTWIKHEKVDGVWVGRKVSMNNLLSKRISFLQTEAVEFDMPIPDDFFTQRSLTDPSFREKHMTGLRALYDD